MVLIAQEDLARLEQRLEHADAAVTLTRREREALLLIEQGCSINAVAGALGVAVSTVVQHLASARRKYGVSTSARAAGCARQAAALD